MAYSPISAVPIQYSKTDGTPANGYYLKFYLENSSTPISMQTDASGATSIAKAKLNESGYPISNPNDENTVFIPHLSTTYTAYRFVLYASAADADANNVTSGLPNIQSVAINQADDLRSDLAASSGASLVGFLQAGAGAENRTIQSKLRETVSVLDFIPEQYHADILAGTSVTDWTTNFEAAIATGKKVFVPKGTYHVSNITCVSGMDIEGEKATGLGIGSHLVVITNDSGAFLNDAAHPDFLSNIRIANFSCTAKTGTTNARFFKQTDKSTYTAYAEFSNNETYQDLVESYDGFFIFTDWDRCRDGYAGNAVGGQTHTFVKAIPATFGQASQTNINQVTKCQIFRNSGANGCLDIAYGALWSIEHTDFEACTTRAVYARGIYALTMRNCWFESLNATEMVVATISPAPNPQGSRPVLLENIYAFCHSSVQYLITIGGASTAGVRNIVLANVPISFKITNASTLTDLENVIVISGSPTDIYNGVKKSVSYELLTSNSEADVNFVNSPYTENQNILPIGPTGLGASNFTLNGFTSATDIASQFGLSSNAVRFSLSGSGNAAYYNLPAKIVKFLRGKTITLTFAGYGSGAGSESVNAAFWEDVGSPSFANKSTSTTYTSGLSYSADMSVGCGKYTVGNSATTLAVGFTAGGNGAGQTYAVESAKLVLGDIKSVSSGFN